MAGTSRDISSVMTSAANNYNTRLDSSFATMLAGLIAPRLRSPASIVARHAITLIVRLGTYYTIVVKTVKILLLWAKINVNF